MQANEYTEYVVALTDPMKARFPLVIVCAIWCIFFAARIAPDREVTHGGEKAANSRQIAEKPALKPFQERAGYIIFVLVFCSSSFHGNL